ncbi:glycogen/starch/alpha-glucan phosphorylase [Aestuariivirga litoralis]|uniref:glycogen/starch/alpha-glucan phosphorylase n=1 Tax=Aestuariivirga litoralis TaxID=2650924 RepID=UPI0018C52B2A|nr:glycogen/starch/alpha-glucan phosphorylase [Aestuariivirga litoralis]MBG1232153.1 glycogen/starch/alpha-glucan phosphorylase [Aestuariivirga litoralis]
MKNTPEAVKADILAKLSYAIGKDRIVAKNHDWLAATILALRDRIIDRWQEATRDSYQAEARRVYYISLEFLIGRLLRDALNNLDLNNAFKQALSELNVDINLAEALEPDAALGNGGLGRLAACFMESMASLDIPAYGYGIRYNHGIFQQIIKDGWQIELPENWLEDGNPWEFSRREAAYKIAFGGHVESTPGKTAHTWHPNEHLLATAFDVPMVGWRGKRVNTLRLWGARAVDPIHLQAFNSGDFDGALAGSRNAEILTRVLYPSDSTPQGQELRLRQEYFATSAAIQDIMRRHTQQYKGVANLADKVAIQINDTHPAIAVAELMRLLIDIHGMPWDTAWSTTQKVLSYTNHTLLPEALETWPVGLFERLLPRHLQIIYAINDLMLAEAHNKFNADDEFIRSVSLIDEGAGRRVKMGNLAFVGSHSINGVSALHTELMKESVFRDLNTLYPGRINNKTNGITPRRWLHNCNPELSKLLAEVGGAETLDNAEKLTQAARIADDATLSKRFADIKVANKAVLAKYVKTHMGIDLDPTFMFDVQVKRIHEYKRQLLNILQVIDHYLAIKANPSASFVPRVKIFAGKAAPSYTQAKLIIKLANEVANVVNADPEVNKQLKVVFMPNYNVSLAEIIVPATDLSEQISTAGMEASGTGNMKFGLNGALTIGTLDGANVEMRDHVGAENFFIFGLEAHEVERRRAKGIDGHGVVENSPRLRAVLRELSKGTFSAGNFQQYNAIADSIYHGDWFMVGQDFDGYVEAQEAVSKAWLQPKDWTRMTIRNSVNMGWFSSDRTIREYARDIWKVPTN